ncbi:MAG TPA: hypothetical protein VKT53_12520 [Candidatus Acidoferrum sp.]|nr:hypothetical protein [Candidatus Acidoferrum sp.]
MNYHMRRRLLWMLFLIGMGVPTVPANATTLARLSFDELAQRATGIVRARCLGSLSLWRNGEIWTETDFAVTAVNKGTAPGILRISLPGGKVGHVQSQVDGVPIFHEGEEAFLFLWEVPGHGTYVLGWAQGTFRIARDARSGEERITQDSAAMPVFDPETHQFRRSGTRNLPLAAFQTKLRRALEGLNP